MIIKCGTGFWTANAWSASGGTITGSTGVSLANQLLGSDAEVTLTTTGSDFNTFSLKQGTTAVSTTRYNNGLGTLYSSLLAVNNDIRFLAGTPLGIEVQFSSYSHLAMIAANPWSSSTDVGARFLAFSIYDDASSSDKVFVLGLTSTGLALVRTDGWRSNTGATTITPTSTNNRTNFSANNPTLVRARVFIDGTDVKVKVVVTHSSSAFYDVVEWTLASDGGAFNSLPDYSYKFAIPQLNGGPHHEIGDLTAYEIEASDISGGYADGTTFQPFLKYVPLTHKTNDAQEYSDPSNDWTDLSGANLGTAWGDITDGSSATGNILGSNEVGIQARRSISSALAAQGYTCGALKSIKHIQDRLADDDGEPVISKIGKVSGGTPVTQTFSGTPGENIMYVHEINDEDAGWSGLGIDKDTTDLFVSLKQVS